MKTMLIVQSVLSAMCGSLVIANSVLNVNVIFISAGNVLYINDHGFYSLLTHIVR